MYRLITALALLVAAAVTFEANSAEPPAAGARSEWVYFDDAGRLAYKTTDAGDRIMDFSAAGYRGGGVAPPVVPVVKTVRRPTAVGTDDEEHDDTSTIQDAIDTVSAKPLVDGVRGAVLLQPGTYRCSRTLLIRAAGVVLRGSGSGDDGTVIEMADRPHLCVRARGPGALPTPREGVRITDRYVPAGTNKLTVADASSFKAGDDVVVRRPVTAAWVHFMGMDDLTRSGRRQLWVRESEISTRRTIRSIDGNRITLDVPLSDSIDAKLLDPPGASVTQAPASQRLSEVGIESLRIRAPALSVAIDQPLYRGVELDAVENAWMRDVVLEHTVNSVHVSGDAARVTLDRVRITHEGATLGSPKPADFTVGGTQVLLSRCESIGDNLFQYTTGARAVGPNVALHCTFGGDGRVQPHQRWATGLLLDNCHAPQGGIDFMNRGSMGSGHGWTIGWAVAWNCTAKSFVIQQPPGTMNWAIGCTGALEDRPRPFGKEGVDPNVPRGTIESHGTPIGPKSLYLAQLRERLGPEALKAIGYTEEDAK
jgi:hypothetical protein